MGTYNWLHHRAHVLCKLPSIADDGIGIALNCHALSSQNQDQARHALGQDTLCHLECSRVYRRVIMLVMAGKPVDATIDSLLQYLEPGDCIIDGGNEWCDSRCTCAPSMSGLMTAPGRPGPMMPDESAVAERALLACVTLQRLSSRNCHGF